ncbi:MAG: metal ABC transporter substrate-binding protein, partial [Chloroflexota bacterium]
TSFMEGIKFCNMRSAEGFHVASEMDDDHSDDDHAEGDDHDHDHAGEAESLGRYYASECAEAEGHGHDHGDDDHSDDDHSDDDHSDDDHGEEGDDHDHDHGACDPHVWMEPHNVMYWTMLIRDTLIELDPANADIYTANAGAYLLELDALMHDFIMPLVDTVPEENRVLITSHDSLGYFADTFGFEVVTTVIPGFSTTADPSASDIADIIELVQEEGVPALFGETTVDDAIIQLIADEADAGFFVLYSGTLSDADGPASTYLDYMRYNTTTIVEALGGSTE